MMLHGPALTRAELSRITVPTLVTAGERDVIREEDTRFIAAHIPHAELKILRARAMAAMCTIRIRSRASFFPFWAIGSSIDCRNISIGNRFLTISLLSDGTY